MGNIERKDDMRRCWSGAVDMLEDTIIVVIEDIERLYGAACHDVVMVSTAIGVRRPV